MDVHPYVVVVYGASVVGQEKTVAEQVTRYDTLTGEPHQEKRHSTKIIHLEWVEALLKERWKAVDDGRIDEYEKQSLAVFDLDDSGPKRMIGTLLFMDDAIACFPITKLDLSEGRKKKTDEALEKNGISADEIGIMIGIRWW